MNRPTKLTASQIALLDMIHEEVESFTGVMRDEYMTPYRRGFRERSCVIALSCALIGPYHTQLVFDLKLRNMYPMLRSAVAHEYREKVVETFRKLRDMSDVRMAARAFQAAAMLEHPSGYLGMNPVRGEARWIGASEDAVISIDEANRLIDDGLFVIIGVDNGEFVYQRGSFDDIDFIPDDECTVMELSIMSATEIKDVREILDGEELETRETNRGLAVHVNDTVRDFVWSRTGVTI